VSGIFYALLAVVDGRPGALNVADRRKSIRPQIAGNAKIPGGYLTRVTGR